MNIFRLDDDELRERNNRHLEKIPMQVKLELETARVKGISFHPTRPWILYCTHTGTVHMHDYELNVELQSYTVTNDSLPVRCVAFHPTQPLFACGTDSYEIVVYNWQKKFKLFSLEGHTDYIRSIEFHESLPLLLSSADDSTARIWNWQNRCCVCILEDHTYFVMSARFNPVQPLVATASLDECVRVFNISTLTQTSMSRDVDSSFFSMDTSSLVSEREEHPEGANTIAWSSDGSRFVSGGEDATIKVFLLGEDVTLIGAITNHMAAVTSIAVHALTNVIISCSEDGTVRFFNNLNFNQIKMYEIPGTRFWCVASHPNNALVAAGHDRGLVVLKMEKERPPYDIQGNSVVWIQEKELHYVEVMSKDTATAVAVAGTVDNVSWNAARNLALVSYSDSKVYEIIDMQMNSSTIKGDGRLAVWLSRSSVAALSEEKDKIIIREVGGVTTNMVPIPQAQRIFSATAQRLYIATRSTLSLYDVARNKTVASVNFVDAKCICYDEKRENICTRNGHYILTAPIDLSSSNIYAESCKIKSCCWCGKVILYTTQNHLKYIFNNLCGIICSLPQVLYLIRACDDKAWFITRDGVVIKREIDMSEIKLKAALSSPHSEEATRRILAGNKPIGFSIMEFAANHKRYDIATSLARDPKTKFQMSIKAGDFETAASAADEINDPKIYKQLSDMAINTGKFELAEKAMKKGNDIESLAFLYTLSGQTDKLAKLCRKSNNLMHYLWCNDEENLKKVLNVAVPALEIEEPEMKVQLGIPVLSDWPITRTTTFISSKMAQMANEEEDEDAAWPSSDEEPKQNDDDEEEETGWDVDIDFGQAVPAATTSSTSFAPPAIGESIPQKWSSTCTTAGDYARAGMFSDALVLLNQSIACRNIDLLREVFVEAYSSANACVFDGYGSLVIPLSSQFRGNLTPVLPDDVPILEVLTKSLFQSFSKGKFSECKNKCMSIFRKVLTTTVQTKEDEIKVQEALDIARNYCLAVSIETTRKTITEPARALELALYLTHIKLLPAHVKIVLQSAMRISMKSSDFLIAQGIIQRLMQMDLNDKLQQQTRAALDLIESRRSNAHSVEYDERNPFNVCGISYKPIYRGKSFASCPYCGQQFMNQYKGKVCPVCEISEIGVSCSGHKIIRGGK